jgi:hypothetical protein
MNRSQLTDTQYIYFTIRPNMLHGITQKRIFSQKLVTAENCVIN